MSLLPSEGPRAGVWVRDKTFWKLGTLGERTQDLFGEFQPELIRPALGT